MMKFVAATLLGTFAAAVGAVDVVSLTMDNYEELTNGKSVFIEFFNPGCPHCKDLAPAWEKLAQEWNGHQVGLIGQVDCSSNGGRPLCNTNSIRGVPTLLWGDPTNLDNYQGSRNFEDLHKFAEEHLSKPICSVDNIDVCDEDTKKTLEQFLELSESEINERVKDAESKIEEVEKEFETAVAKLQEEFQKLLEEKDASIESVKKEGLGLLKSVRSHNARAAKSKDEL